MCFINELSMGAAVRLIQLYIPETEESIHKIEYFQWAIVFVCGGAAVFGLLIIAVLWRMEIGQR